MKKQPSLRKYTAKALEFFAKADPATIENGKRWYLDAHEFAVELSEKYGVCFTKVCGVISALSPGNEWSVNKQEAEMIIFAYVYECGTELPRFRTYSANASKAWYILSSKDSGADAIAKLIMPKPTSGWKTHAFYWNILNPMGKQHVTIDRHMVAVLGFERDTPTSLRQYKMLSDAVVRAARKVQVRPLELQAILWVLWVQMK